MTTYARFFHRFHGYKRWLLLSFILNIIIACGTLAIPALSADLIDQGIIAQNFQYSLDTGTLMLLAAVIAGICQIVNAAIAVWISASFSHQLRKDVFEKIQTLSFGNVDRFRSSLLLVRLTIDIQNVKTALQQSVMNLMQAPLLIIGTILIMSVMSPIFQLIMVVILILLTIILVLYFIIVEPAFSRKQEKIDQVNQSLRETLTGIRVVKAFVRQAYEIKKFSNSAEELKKAALRPQYMMAYLMPTVFCISVLGFGAVYAIGGAAVIAGRVQFVGDITAAAEYIMVLMMPLLIIALVLPFITQANASMRSIFEVLDAVSDIKEPEDPVIIDPSSISGRVVFDHVSFGYLNAEGRSEGEALSDISLVVEPGQSIGILGATGSGKSSLVSLIPRFYDLTRGMITIDGIDIRSIPLSILRSLVTVCLQEPVLFSGTIRETIRFGRPEMSDDEIRTTSEIADVDGFVENIPEMYDGRVSRRGSNFSGGQRQRLAIARALATHPKILILDDSTSACDVATEARIQDAISRKMHGVTKFIVAQRISSVITADQIILLDQGRIVGSGTHDELLKTNDLYQEIYESQLGGRRGVSA